MSFLDNVLGKFGLSWSGSYEEYYNQKEDSSVDLSLPPKAQTVGLTNEYSREKIALLISSRIYKENLPKEQWLHNSKAIEEKMNFFRFMPYQTCNCFYLGDGTAWTGYNGKNKNVLKLAINQINFFLEESKSLDNVIHKTIPNDYYIDFSTIKFDEPFSYGLPRSYLIYQPETKKQKLSQYPLIAFFNTCDGTEDQFDESYMGELYYAINGDLAKAVIHCHKHGKFAEFLISVVGKTLLISKIKTLGKDGKLFTLYDCEWKFTNYKDFII